MNDKRDDQQLVDELGRQLRDSEASVDVLTAARLQAARRRARDTGDRCVTRDRFGWTLGGFATAAVAVLAVVLWTGNETPAPELFGADMEMLAEGDLQLIEELEFYDWLPEEDTAG